MLKKVDIRFKYMDFVSPDSKEVKKIAHAIKKQSKQDVGKAVCEWINNNINYAPTEPSPNLHPDVVLRERKGTCLANSILMTSILRALGFNQNEVFVIIMLHKGENALAATHASTIIVHPPNLNDNSNVIFLDPFNLEGLYALTNLEAILSTNVIVLIFNDKLAYVPQQLPIHD